MLPRRARCVVCRAPSGRGSSRRAPGPSVQRAMRERPAGTARPLLWGCPRTESGPANAVSEPVALSSPVIQSTASHTSHTALPGLQPSRVPLTTLSQRASLISRAGEPLRCSVQIRGAQGCSFLGALARGTHLSAITATGAASLLTTSGFCGGIALTGVSTASQVQSSGIVEAWRALSAAN